MYNEFYCEHILCAKVVKPEIYYFKIVRLRAPLEGEGKRYRKKGKKDGKMGRKGEGKDTYKNEKYGKVRR